MVAVIFEVWPNSQADQSAYLDLAANLRPMLEGRDGFISIERFQSLTEEGKILSLSFWRDEAAIEKWRREEPHVAAQLAGRNRLFRNYRLRVAEIARDYGKNERTEAPPEFRDRF